MGRASETKWFRLRVAFALGVLATLGVISNAGMGERSSRKPMGDRDDSPSRYVHSRGWPFRIRRVTRIRRERTSR